MFIELMGALEMSRMCLGVWFYDFQDDGFNSALHGLQ